MKNKVVIFVTGGVLLLELIIYLAAASQSGKEYHVIIEDNNGTVLYKTRGRALTRYEEISFRSTFGPIEKYRVRVVQSERPFPFRGWLASAVGIPVGLVLLVAFAVKSYQALFEYKSGMVSEKRELTQLRGWKYFFQLLGSLSVFQLGFMVATLAIIVWVVPNITEAFITAVAVFVEKHSVLVLSILAFIAGLIVWIIYLRYKLSREIVKYQFELSKIKLEKMKQLGSEGIPLLETQLPGSKKDRGAGEKSNGMVQKNV